MNVIQKELKCLLDKQTNEFVDLPMEVRALKNKWVFWVKSEQTNSMRWCKAKLVLKEIE